ncbi:hypothetical protein [Leptothermofonsia sp. ETS-13]|uniref:hypothetical protein n=1 Tax=Leptothermofonsia sp. ETS-13 TaxID=3035696 RepID=UPI003B9EAFB3
MADIHGHNPSAARRNSSSKVNGVSLTQWIYQNAGINQGRVSSRLRGNNLHILLESNPCPDAALVVPKLSQALAAVPLNRLLLPDTPQIYRVILYGRQTNETKPAWTQSFYLTKPTQSREQKSASTSPLSEVDSVPQNESSSLVSLAELARLGQPDAIARYLSHAFSGMEVAVKARVEVIGKLGKAAGEGEREGVAETAEISPSQVQKPKPQVASFKRLFIVCESAYSPDPLILAEPISQRLRSLELQGFRDAAVFGQVRGEAQPEWVLRVDLTPTDEILQEWARWGDVQAIARLLNRLLHPEGIQVSALLKDSTLHLTCESTRSTVPDKLTAIAAITPALKSLAPQGIRAVAIYGVCHTEPGDSSLPLSPNFPVSPAASPHWVHWLNLPATEQPELAKSPLELAQAANLKAIGFLLTRLLNPNLDRMLATGGIRVQIRQKGDLLHIMTDAPTCPSQSQVGPEINRFLKPLPIAGVAGIRVYGRRAGQKQPLWSYGTDFTARNRLVPEATPEFAASDAYVNDLLEPPGALVLRSDLPPNDVRSILSRWLEGMVHQVQRSLIQSQLFAPLETADLSSELLPVPQTSIDPTYYRGTKVAIIWGTVGLLLVVQADWILGQLLRPTPPRPATPAPSASPTSIAKPLPSASPLPQITLKKTPSADPSAFNSSGFTQPGQVVVVPSPQPSDRPDSSEAPPISSTNLPASPLQPKANLNKNAFPTFNSRQLDEKVTLYQRYVEENGPPDVLVVGSSRALRGVDPVALEKFLAEQGYPGVKVFNFGINGATAQVVDLILRQLLPQEKLPKLILFADGARAFNSGRLDITYNGIVASEGYRMLIAGKPPIPGTLAQAARGLAKPNLSEPASVTEESSNSLSNVYQAINRELDKRLGALSQLYAQRDRLKSVLSEQLAGLLPKSDSFIAFGQRMSPGELSDATSPAASALNSPPSILTEGGTADVNGFLPLPNRFNPVTYYQKYARVSGDYDSDYESFSMEGRQTESMIAIAQFAQTHQVPFVFVNLPLTSDYLDPIRKRYEEIFQQYMLQLASQYGFTYRDLSLVLADQPDYFSDPSHLNRYGAYNVSRRLAEDIMIPWQKTR